MTDAEPLVFDEAISRSMTRLDDEVDGARAPRARRKVRGEGKGKGGVQVADTPFEAATIPRGKARGSIGLSAIV